MEQSNSGMKVFVYGVIAVVAATIVYGFFVAGSPAEERLRKFDAIRLNNLQQIQQEVFNYYQVKRIVPTSLADLNDKTRGVQMPGDPENGTAYEYHATPPLSFSLCATFSLEGTSMNDYYYPAAPVAYTSEKGPIPSGSWDHEAGHVCFDRTIDPDWFPPQGTSPVKGL